MNTKALEQGRHYDTIIMDDIKMENKETYKGAGAVIDGAIAIAKAYELSKKDEEIVALKRKNLELEAAIKQVMGNKLDIIRENEELRNRYDTMYEILELLLCEIANQK